MPRDREEFNRKFYSEMAERLGQDALWVEERVEGALKRQAEYQQEWQERERKKFPGKPDWLAKNLIKVVNGTTARYEDLPERKSPLKEVTDFEWRQALAIVQEHREGRAARTVDGFVQSNKAKQAHHDLTYVLRNHEYGSVDRLPYYIELLRKAERNYIAIADALEAERQRMSSQKPKGVGS